jgi:hypothetical protein
METLSQRWQSFWLVFSLSCQIRWGLWRLKRGVKAVRQMNPRQAAPIFTKWKWDASRIKDEEIRESFLTMLEHLEDYVKSQNQDKPDIESKPSFWLMLLLVATVVAALYLAMNTVHWLFAPLFHHL